MAGTDLSSDQSSLKYPKKADLDASKLKVTLTENPRPVPAPDSAEANSKKVCTDHMIVAKWTEEHGWEHPELKPYGPLSLLPTASALQYATECFEGMKVFRGNDGRLRLFRPQLNATRMLTSSSRICLPGFDPDELVELIRKLCAVDCPKWLPKDQPGSFLYIRPTMIGLDPSLGFDVPKEALLYIMISYWPLVKEPPPKDGETKPKAEKGLRLYANSEETVRAWPGGTGYAKLGANYGPTLPMHSEARRLGYDQVLWLLGPECWVTEAGATNLFVIWRTEQGRLQLITPPLHDQTILAGVTRRSILELACERLTTPQKFVPGTGITPNADFESLEVLERSFSMFDIVSAAEQGRLLGSFCVGTAFFVMPVSQINFRGRQINISTDAIPHVQLLRKWLSEIMFGDQLSKWAEIVEDEE